MEVWASEEYNDIRLSFRVKRTLFTGRSRFQEISVIETESCGKLLLLDDAVMFTERFEFVYHDMLVHVPLFLHPSPGRVLIVGGGDGGAAREASRHSSVANIDLVDIDEMVIEVSRKYIPSTGCGFDDPKVNVTVADGIDFVGKSESGTYDVICIDSTDPVPGGPGFGLFSPSFYRDLHRILSDDGIITAQIASPWFDHVILRDYYRMISEIFPIARIYLAFTPDYPAGMWAFGFASKRYDPVDDYDPMRYANSEIECRYYNPEIHTAAFALPGFVRENLDKSR